MFNVHISHTLYINAVRTKQAPIGQRVTELVQLRLPEQGHEVTMEYIACIRDTVGNKVKPGQEFCPPRGLRRDLAL